MHVLLHGASPPRVRRSARPPPPHARGGRNQPLPDAAGLRASPSSVSQWAPRLGLRPLPLRTRPPPVVPAPAGATASASASASASACTGGRAAAAVAAPLPLVAVAPIGYRSPLVSRRRGACTAPTNCSVRSTRPSSLTAATDGWTLGYKALRLRCWTPAVSPVASLPFTRRHADGRRRREGVVHDRREASALGLAALAARQRRHVLALGGGTARIAHPEPASGTRTD
eukprot:scaffold5640_cov328-Prasinococcus_capsulatus_cf.AAC.4